MSAPLSFHLSNTIKGTIIASVRSVSSSFVRNTHLQKSLMRGVRRGGGIMLGKGEWAVQRGGQKKLPKIFSLKIFLSKIFLTQKKSLKIFLSKIFPNEYIFIINVIVKIFFEKICRNKSVLKFPCLRAP